MNKAVLLTNAQLRKTLAAVRSIGSQGVHVSVAETTRFNPAAYSTYCSKIYVSPDPSKDECRYVDWLIRTMQTNNIKVLIPMDDNTMDAVMNHRSLFQEVCALVLPPMESYNIASDKGKSVQLAELAGIPVPTTLQPKSLDEVIQIASRLTFPVVIKPRFSSGSRGIQVVGGPEQLISQYPLIHQRYPFPTIQEFIPPGERYDVCLLYDNEGKLKASFVQKELRHFPIDRGPSTLQESVIRPDLIKLSLDIMRHIPWHGVVEIEFMIDPRDGIPKFMEINSRFWNSLQTSIFSGINFPWLLYRIACGETVEDSFDYREGVLCISLLPSDMLHYLSNPRRFSIKPRFWSGPKSGGIDDILSWKDPMPTIGFILACLRYISDPDAWKLLFNRS